MSIFMYRVRAVGSGWTGAPGLATFYFRGASPSITTAGEALEAAKRVRAYFVAAAANTASTVSWDVSESVDVIQDTDGGLGFGYAVAAQTTVPGTTGTRIDSPNTAIVGQLLTSSIVRGRRVRGRTYYSPIADGISDSSGNPASGAVTAATAGLTALSTTITTAITPVVWSRPIALTSTAGLACDVTGASVYSRFGTLRSRRD